MPPLILAVVCAVAAGCGDTTYQGQADNQYAHAVEMSFAGENDELEIALTYVVPADSRAFLFQGPGTFGGHLRVFDADTCRLLGEADFDGDLLRVTVAPEGDVELLNHEPSLVGGDPMTSEAQPKCS